MDLDPDDDQRALQDTVARFAADRWPMERVREAAEGIDRSAWRELAELGTFVLSVPEAEGGVGLRAIDAVLVHEALGAALVPGPLIGSTLAAPFDADVAAGVALAGVIEPRVGTAMLVEHASSLDSLWIVRDSGVSVVAVDELDLEPVRRPIDPTTPLALARDLPAGTEVGGPELAAHWRRSGTVLAAAQLVGGSEASTALAVAYASEREQFGRPVGSFQGLKHLLADSFVRTELARSALWAAGVLLDEPDAGDPDRAIAGAMLLAARAATENAKTCVQVHGGMGFTWEVDAHLHLKRAWVLETMFGSTDDDARLVADRFATEVGR